MTSRIVRTCVRCHSKKIRCSGHPDCQTCTRAQSQCQLYRRQRKKDGIEALQYYKDRTIWLEGEIQHHFRVPCAGLATGTSLRPHSKPNHVQANVGGQEPLPESPRNLGLSAPHTSPQAAAEVSPSVGHAPEAGIVALNATGDMRFLGPSSGIFFALHANAFAQPFHPDHSASSDNPDVGIESEAGFGNIEDPPLNSEAIQFLLQSYRVWIEPLYPVLTRETADALVSKYCEAQGRVLPSIQTQEETIDLCVFYLVLALGTLNKDNTMKLLRGRNVDVPEISSASLCRKAMRFINISAQLNVPSIRFIQCLLLFSIYSMHGSTANNQWQLVGSAMRLAVELGLHSSSRTSNMTELALEERKRIFWTAYSLEISLAYNLGRPPSIGEEHITVELPALTMTGVPSILHFKHRRIQSRIVAKVYGANRDAVSIVEVQAQIAQLQQELDAWKEELANLTENDLLAYPYRFWLRLYHGTTFVLHRASPLCPDPPRESIQTCLRSAGAYTADVLHVLQHSHVPLSWMLVQGVLFAGLTMLVTARMGCDKFDQQADLTLVLVDIPTWTRQCSNCLAIMNERWEEPLLSKVTVQFEGLVNDTLKSLMKFFTKPQQESISCQTANAGGTDAMEVWSMQDHSMQEDGMLDQGSYFELMRDVMGFDPDQNFWDSFSMF